MILPCVSCSCQVLYEQNASVAHASLHFVDDTCLQVGCLLFLVEMLCSNFDSNFLFFQGLKYILVLMSRLVNHFPEQKIPILQNACQPGIHRLALF